MRLVPRWLPNAISTLRIALVPGWVALAEAANRAAETGGPAERLRWSAVAVLIAIGVSDVLDGFLARRFGLQSHLGAVLDAVADKLAQVVVFFYLALRQGPEFATVPLWFLLVLVGRDLLLLLGCAIVRWRAGRVRVDHRPHGKAVSLVLFALSVVCTAGFGDHLVVAVFGSTAALMGLSTALYVRDGFRQVAVARALRPAAEQSGDHSRNR